MCGGHSSEIYDKCIQEIPSSSFWAYHVLWRALALLRSSLATSFASNLGKFDLE